jgi:hypothetical protein
MDAILVPKAGMTLAWADKLMQVVCVVCIVCMHVLHRGCVRWVSMGVHIVLLNY